MVRSGKRLHRLKVLNISSVQLIGLLKVVLGHTGIFIWSGFCLSNQTFIRLLRWTSRWWRHCRLCHLATARESLQRAITTWNCYELGLWHEIFRHRMQLGLKPCCESRRCFCRTVASCPVTASTDVVPQGIQCRYLFLNYFNFFVKKFISRPFPSVLLSSCLSVCKLSGNSSRTVCQILIKFGMSFLQKFVE